MKIFTPESEIQRMGRAPQNGDEKLVILGTGQGRDIRDLYARLPDGPNQPPSQYLWARDLGSNTPFEIIGGAPVTIGHDVHVWVEWLSAEGMWRLKRADLSYLAAIKRSVHFDNPNDAHNQNHRTEQLLPLRCFPAGGMKAAVAGVRFTDKRGRNVGWKGTSNVDGHLHIDLTSYVPATTGHKCFALVYFDVEEYHLGNHPIGVVVSTSQAGALDDTDIQECLDQLNALGTEYLESLALRLDNGQTVWRGHGDDQDRRPWLTGNGDNSGMTSFTVSADSGDDAIVENDDTLTFTGAGGIVTSVDDATKTVIIDGSGITGGGINEITGDVTAGPGSGSQAATLATVNSDVGTYTYATITVDGKGRITAANSGTAPAPTALDLLNQTAGEDVADNDNVYQEGDAWFLIDNNALPIEVGTERGVVVTGVLMGATNLHIRREGLMDGYSGLTPGLPLYASGTPGGYTQTKPALTAGGGQIVICEMGMALSATDAWIEPKPVEFHKREILANAATLSITHYADAQGRSRKTRASIASSTTVLLETYATSNRDSAVQLKGQSGAGTTTTPSSVSNAVFALGDSGGNEFQVAQSMTFANAGALSSFTVSFGATTGTPSQAPIWEFCDDSGGNPGAVLASGTMGTITASADNTVSGITGLFIVTGTTYWLKLRLPAQATNNTYTVNRQNTNPYANGVMKADQNSAGTWAALVAGSDMRCSVTLAAVVLNDAVAQGFSHASSTDILYIDLYVKRTGTRTGDLTLEIQSNSAGLPSGTAITNGVSAVVSASSVDTNWELKRFTFSSPAITGGTQYHFVLKTTDAASNTAYIEVGTDVSSPGYANGVVSLLQSSSWGAASPAADACFSIYGVGTYYDQPIGNVGLGSPVLNAWYGDTSFADQDTTTTFENVYGVTIDVVGIVEME